MEYREKLEIFRRTSSERRQISTSEESDRSFARRKPVSRQIKNKASIAKRTSPIHVSPPLSEATRRRAMIPHGPLVKTMWRLFLYVGPASEKCQERTPELGAIGVLVPRRRDSRVSNSSFPDVAHVVVIVRCFEEARVRAVFNCGEEVSSLLVLLFKGRGG